MDVVYQVFMSKLSFLIIFVDSLPDTQNFTVYSTAAMNTIGNNDDHKKVVMVCSSRLKNLNTFNVFVWLENLVNRIIYFNLS